MELSVVTINLGNNAAFHIFYFRWRLLSLRLVTTSLPKNETRSSKNAMRYNSLSPVVIITRDTFPGAAR